MQIGKILFPVKTLGPFDRVGIWLLGCNRRCRGCANPELRIRDVTKDISVKSIIDLIKQFGAKHVTISGGEPFYDPSELKKLIFDLRNFGIDDILVYSGNTYEELKEMHSDDVNYILDNISVLVDGEFIMELLVDNPLFGSKNQRMIVLNDKYKDDYINFLKDERKIQIFKTEGEIHFIGIPIEGYRRKYKEFIED